jgi:hypothetical protein
MPIVQQGAINTTALVVPDLYVQIVPPQNLVLNGVPTNVAGVVGTASWGPVGKPTICSSMADYARQFGPVMNRKYDAGTTVAVARQQGASDFRVVRVTDGTDIAAGALFGFSGGNFAFGLNAIYTGTLGNSMTTTLSAGSAANSWRLTISMPGMVSEVFDNIGGTAAQVYAGCVAAVNNGQSAMRGPSQLAVAYIGTLTPTVAAATRPFANGTDGTTTISASTLIGVDTVPRTGMYALREQGCSLAALADADDSTQWTTQAAFGLSEGIYMILTGPAGDTIANAVSTKATAGLDTYSCKLMFGDWIYWNDQTNGVLRLISPQGFALGRLANLSPEQSSLNKQLYSVVGSQKSGTPGTGQALSYSAAELGALLQVGIDVIANPQPGGAYWGVRGGHNSSSNAATNGDNYTRMTNYIAATLASGMGSFLGQVVNPVLFRRIRSTQLSFFQNMLSQGLLGLNSDGSLPFSVICDASNNPDSRTGIGYVQSDAQVRYQAINEKFIVNVEGGTTVQVSRQTLPNGRQ